MIIPISNGKTITPIYIPQPTVSHSTTQVSDQVSDQVAYEITGVDIFFSVLIIVFLLSVLIYFIHLLKELTK